ncbi:MAG: 3-isopropylmalate dehydratase small subunit [Pseudomonadota bacterium]
MSGFSQIRSHTAVLNRNDVDTDQIIPARFLTTTSRQGLGKSAFADWRYLDDGEEDPSFELNQPHNRGAEILVAGRNFGCGSSREHAPWSLTDFGFKAVISSEIADIFRSNSLKNGLVPVIVDKAMHERLLAQQHDVLIDLESRTIAIMENDEPIANASFEIDNFSRFCIMQGTDQLGFLLSQMPAIEAFERARGDYEQ